MVKARAPFGAKSRIPEGSGFLPAPCSRLVRDGSFRSLTLPPEENCPLCQLQPKGHSLRLPQGGGLPQTPDDELPECWGFTCPHYIAGA